MSLTNHTKKADTDAGMLHYQHQQTSGTDGGTSAAADWQKLTLNTEIWNTITGASVATSQVTLPAGTYECYASCNGFQCNAMRLRLRDTTGSADLLYGVNGRAQATDNSVAVTTMRGRFTLTVESVLELQLYTSTAKATTGLGFALTTGEVEVFNELMIEEIVE